MGDMSNRGLTEPQWNLGDRLRKIRRDRHLTQEEFAHEIGATAVALAAWESGRTRPRDVIALAATIERRYGVPAAWTLGVLQSFDRRQQNLPQQQNRRWTDYQFPKARTA